MAVSILGEAAVRLRPETSGFAAEADSDLSGDLPGIAKKAAGFFAAAFAAVKIGGFIKDAIGEASDLSESASKVGVVFGDNSKQVLDFAANASTAFGQTRGQALEAAGTFGNLLRSIGMTASESANMSTRMVGLASDLASFNNTDPAEALDALRSGLTGETEPLKRYGINLNDATLKQEAMRLGLDTSGATLSASTKAQAAYSLILAQSTLAQGDFARTSAGLANQQRIIHSQFTDISANIGGLFVPAVAGGAGIISGSLLPGLLHLTAGLPAVGTAIGSVGQIIRTAFVTGDTDAIIGKLGEGLPRAIGAAADEAGYLGGVFTEAMADGQVGATLLAEGGLPAIAGRLGILAQQAGVFGLQLKDSLGAAFADVQTRVGPALTGVMGALSSAAGPIMAAFSGLFSGGGGGNPFAGLATMIGPALDAVVPLISGLINKWLTIFQAALPAITSLITSLVPVIQQVVGQIGPIFQALAPILAQISGVYLQLIVTAFQALTPVIPPLVSAIGQVVSILAGALLSALTSLAPVIPTLVTAIGQIAQVLAGALGTALQAIIPILPVLATVIAQVATMLAGALAGALQAIIPILPPIIDALATVAQVLIGALMGALQAILPIIPQIVNLFLSLIQAALIPLLPILPVLANLLATIIAALAPLIPVIVQVVAMLIQLAIAAVMPLLPIIVILANLFSMLIRALIPIIQVIVTVVGAFIGMAATILGAVIGFVTMVLGIWARLYSGIASVFGAIFSVISGVWTSIFGFVSGIVTRIAGTISGVFSGVGRAISGVFTGIGNAVGGVFDSAVGAIKGSINVVIGFLNGAIHMINRNLIDVANRVPFVSIPHIPDIPRLHEGGVFSAPGGEGLALLRDSELVVTPEQRATANDLLSEILGTRPPAAAAAGTPAPSVVIQEHLHAAPGESLPSLAARVTQGVVWNLNAGITRPAGAGAR